MVLVFCFVASPPGSAETRGAGHCEVVAGYARTRIEGVRRFAAGAGVNGELLVVFETSRGKHVINSTPGGCMGRPRTLDDPQADIQLRALVGYLREHPVPPLRQQVREAFARRYQPGPPRIIAHEDKVWIAKFVDGRWQPQEVAQIPKKGLDRSIARIRQGDRMQFVLRTKNGVLYAFVPIDS